MIKSAAPIIESLYERRFVQNNESVVTSSHWKEIGGHEVTRDKNGKLELNGIGFGYFRPISIRNKAYFAAELGLTRWLELKHQADQEIKICALKICKATNRLYDFDCLKQLLSAQRIHAAKSIQEFETVCIIGDGYGFMGSLLKKHWPHLRIVSVNLGRTLLFDVHFTEKAFPHASFKLLQKNDFMLNCDFNFLEAENYELIKELKIDLFINIASMQEMDNYTINNYFQYIKGSKAEKKYFYCCNRIEKSLPDGQITRIDQYPWAGWKMYFNELCSWYQAFPIHKPPFWKKFDGPIKHILAKI